MFSLRQISSSFPSSFLLFLLANLFTPRTCRYLAFLLSKPSKPCWLPAASLKDWGVENFNSPPDLSQYSFYTAINNVVFGVGLATVAWISEQLIISKHLKTRREKNLISGCHSQGYNVNSTRRHLSLQFSKWFSDGTALFLGTKSVFVPKTSLICKQTRSCPRIFNTMLCMCDVCVPRNVTL